MEMEVMMPSPAVDFNFDSACTSPYVSSPSSPQRFGNFFFSAPTSPSRVSSFYRQLNDAAAGSSGESPSAVPFIWEEKPGIPKTKAYNGNEDNDFEFDFSGQLQINEQGGLNDSTKSPISTKIFGDTLSPRRKKKDFDPFAEAIEQTRREVKDENRREERGRLRRDDSSSASLRQKGTRSLSPFRVCDIFVDREIDQQGSNSSKWGKSKPSHSKASSFSFSNTAWKGYKKWNLKDLLLFRSASEGRASSKDPLRKYSLLKKSADDRMVSGRRRRGPPASAHELHYTANRAVSEEMKKKTFLPYKQGLLGCLGFNPAVHDISRGLIL
ncbi:hypothetical protein NMG60_11015318 [Bertholletia excelsa]